MTNRNFESGILSVFAIAIALNQSCWADSFDRTAIISHQDQLQNVILDCEETRTYEIDPAVAAREQSQIMRERIGSHRSETYSVSFSFLDGNIRFERTISPTTLNFWLQNGLPAIVWQIQSISSAGRVEELTTQQLTDGRRPSFGGIRQLNIFAPDTTIDIALGLRLLGARQWLSGDTLAGMEQVTSSDPNIVILRTRDGTGHTHELHFDRRLLYAMVYYRCTSSHGPSVEITNSDFHRHGNVFVPGQMVRVSNIPNATGQIRHPLVFSISVKTASINDPGNVLARYLISWPARMRLFDARTAEEVDVGPTTRPLTDGEIHQQIAERTAYQQALEAATIQRMNRVLQNSPTTRP
jgi:hypothetical protein